MGQLTASARVASGAMVARAFTSLPTIVGAAAAEPAVAANAIAMPAAAAAAPHRPEGRRDYSTSMRLSRTVATVTATSAAPSSTAMATAVDVLDSGRSRSPTRSRTDRV